MGLCHFHWGLIYIAAAMCARVCVYVCCVHVCVWRGCICVGVRVCISFLSRLFLKGTEPFLLLKNPASLRL